MTRIEKRTYLGAVTFCAAALWLSLSSCFGATTAVRYHAYELPWPDQVFLHEPYVYAMNNAGVVAGFTLSGQAQALRWDPTNPANVAAGYGATLLPNLGVRQSSGIPDSHAYAVNEGGTVAGTSLKSIGRSQELGWRAVKWAPGASEPLELPVLSTNSVGLTSDAVYGINNAGAAVGYARRYSGDTIMGFRPALWDATTNALTELRMLGDAQDSGQFVNGYARDINNAGVIIGDTSKVTNGVVTEVHAVKWDAVSALPTELPMGRPYGINDAGTIVGHGAGNNAARLDPGSSAPVSLLPPVGASFSSAWDINELGAIAGQAWNGNDRTAVLWEPGQAVGLDLQTLIDASSGWNLSDAYGVNDLGWISGSGLYDPDGAAGPQGPHFATFVLVPVPEPGALTGVLALAGTVVTRRRRRRRRAAA